ncbi:MAG: YicC family protein [Verrucomicrobia bacterium]|nr:YicC family protein [Verrucomicrobiota bacterium]MCH8512106.1 YicC family protein [Kiritimatiellia bacterium]
MKSMTGFGQGTASAEGVWVRVELSTVNRRNLDAQVSLPRAFSALEANCLQVLQKRLHRGRVQVRVDVQRDAAESSLILDEARADAALRKINAYAASRNLSPVASVREVVTLPGILRDEESALASTEVVQPLEAALNAALDDLIAMREREGEHLRETLGEQLAGMGDLMENLEPLIAEARESLVPRFRKAMQDLQVDPDAADVRLWQEVALYGERSDVREETDRIRGHLQQAAEKISGDEPCGRALDFLCQEMAREFNTLSVKAARADINRLALEGKERVEMFREQVQNVE